MIQERGRTVSLFLEWKRRGKAADRVEENEKILDIIEEGQMGHKSKDVEKEREHSKEEKVTQGKVSQKHGEVEAGSR
jgi:hypothetical protein